MEEASRKKLAQLYTWYTVRTTRLEISVNEVRDGQRAVLRYVEVALLSPPPQKKKKKSQTDGAPPHLGGVTQNLWFRSASCEIIFG